MEAHRIVCTILFTAPSDQTILHVDKSPWECAARNGRDIEVIFGAF